MIKNNSIDENFQWENEPRFFVEGHTLTMHTAPETDLWQKTHYGFVRDNAHCLVTKEEKNFSLSVRTVFKAKSQYDQCGLIVRLDSENWIKLSAEYESKNHSRLGSVVTNYGYSDWSTFDILAPVAEMWYRIQSKGNDFLLEYSLNGKEWKQQRIAHLHEAQPRYSVGVYACSPGKCSFEAAFDQFELGPSDWD